jgi:hypothetical protein
MTAIKLTGVFNENKPDRKEELKSKVSCKNHEIDNKY